LNKPKRPLRSTLQELAETFAEAVIAAARESLFEFSPPQPRAEPKRERPRAAKPKAPATNAARTKRPRATAPEPVSHAHGSDQLITDPQALLAALETAAPAGWEASHEPPTREEREEPEILRPPASAVVPVRTLAPPALRLREGEEIVRRSAGGIVLRRRRG
jgi:hypothetical protein